MAQKRKTTSAAAKAKTTKGTAAKKTTARKATAKRTTAKSSTASKTTAAKKTTAARKTTAAKTTTTARKTTAAKKTTPAGRTTTARKTTAAKKTTTARKAPAPKPVAPPKAPIPVPMPMPAKPVATGPYFEVYEMGTDRNNWFFSLYTGNGQELMTSFGCVTRDLAEEQVRRAIEVGTRRSRYRIRSLVDFESFFVLKDREGEIAKSGLFWDPAALDRAIRQTIRAVKVATIRG